MKLRSLLLLSGALIFTGACAGGGKDHSHQHSPYAEEEKRTIKSLSDTEIAALTNGEGAGLAKIAELNSFPGPKHILENESAMELSAEQKAEVQKSFQKMKDRAVELGKQIVEREREFDELFRQSKVDEATLQDKTQSIAKLQGELRATHLQAHLEMKKLLSPPQVEKYNRLRGYQN